MSVKCVFRIPKKFFTFVEWQEKLILMLRPLLKSICLLSALSGSISLHAQVWTDAASLPLYGKATEETVTRYSRLPASLQEVCRKPVWRLGQNSAGEYIRFRTDSPTLWVRWESQTAHVMNHMSPTGSRGLDLYVHTDGGWRFVRSARPELKASETTRKVLSEMEPEMREYMLYLSLYDGVTSLKIGTEEGHPVLPGAVPTPRAGQPVVMYGTSITQGGCVSRPGMCYTSIMSRELDREFINLGFSGNALLDPEIAELMASVPDPALFVLACVENATAEQIAERGESFFRTLRKAHPAVPVVFVQAVRYAHSALDRKEAARMEAKMAAWQALYDRLRKAGEKRIYFADPGGSEAFSDAEQSVDGCHLTDLGTMRFSEELLPTLKKALRRSR